MSVIEIGVAPPPVMAEDADPELVATLAKMLRDAEQGRIVSVAMAAIVVDDQGDRASRTAFVAPCGSDMEWMIGTMEVIKHRLLGASFSTAREPSDWPTRPDSG